MKIYLKNCVLLLILVFVSFSFISVNAAIPGLSATMSSSGEDECVEVSLSSRSVSLKCIWPFGVG